MVSQFFLPIVFRAFCVVSIVLATSTKVCWGQSSDALKFPYQAFVLKDETLILSGPGESHYPTEELDQGATVEVHREDPGGWFAIRPVNGSFSLVPEAALEMLDKNVGRVIESGTQAWVGTKLGPVEKPLWQVKLKNQEIVEVLGLVSWPSPDGHSTTWYQIAPPAGEFRWVKRNALELPSEAVGAIVSNDSPNKEAGDLAALLNRGGHAESVDSFDGDGSDHLRKASLELDPTGLQAAAVKTENVNQGWRPTPMPIGVGESLADLNRNRLGVGVLSDGTASQVSDGGIDSRFGYQGTLDLATGPSSNLRVANRDISRNGFANSLDQVRQGGAIRDPSMRYSRSLSDLELQLTQELIKEDPSAWQLNDLERAANAIYRTSNREKEKFQAKKFLAKLKSCRMIQTGLSGAGNAATIGVGVAPNQPIGTGVNAELDLSNTYDAHGWLSEIVRNGASGRSEYVLLNEEGNITHHVGPSPGMNLKRYLRSRIGIVGQRGYTSELQLDHVTATRVVLLEKPKSNSGFIK
ncbi:MAG: hypothetical protein ACKVHR_03050 [Pirellulales bacterium]|jgi:hypothetical protein